MKVVHFTRDKKDKKPGALDHTLGNVRPSFLKKKPKAQTIVIDAWKKVLDNKYFMLCDVVLAGLDVPIPLILVGPPGIWVIYPSSSKGIRRAYENAWEVMDERTQRYIPGKPNLIVVADSMAKAVEEYLSGYDFHISAIEPLLIFTNPGVHIETSRPAVRIIMVDALERFAAGLFLGESLLNSNDIQKAVDALSGIEQGVVETNHSSVIHDAYSLRELTPERKPVRLPQMPNVAREELQIIREVSQRVTFTKRQWFLLGLLLVVNIFIVIVLVLVVVTSF